MVCDQERDKRAQFFGGVMSNRRGKFKILGLQEDSPQSPPLVGHLDLPIRKVLMKVVGLLSVMILKRVCESIFF